MYLESAAISVLLKLAKAVGVRVAIALLKAAIRRRKRKRAPRKARGARRVRRRA